MLVSFENGFGQSLSYDLLLREVVKAMSGKGCRNSLVKLCHVLSFHCCTYLYDVLPRKMKVDAVSQCPSRRMDMQ